MHDINIDDLPILEFDATMPDTEWGQTVTASVTVIVAGLIAIFS